MDNQPGTVDELTELYRDTIVKHAVAPVGFKADIDATHNAEVFNPLCGDRIEILLRIAGESIEDIAFRGEACAICMASASLLCENQANASVAEFAATHTWLEESLANDNPESENDALRPLLGVRAYPSRVKCALLPWEAVEKAIRAE